MPRTLPPLDHVLGDHDPLRTSLLYAASKLINRLPADRIRAIEEQIAKAFTKKFALPKKYADCGRVDLAILAHVRRSPPLADVVDEFGHEFVLAVIARDSTATASLESLAVVNEILIDSILSHLDATLSHLRIEQRTVALFGRLAESRGKSNKGLKKARPMAAKKISDTAKTYKENARAMATDYKRAHPAASVNDIVEHLKKSESFSKWKKDSSYRTAIKGVATAALRDAPPTARSSESYLRR